MGGGAHTLVATFDPNARRMYKDGSLAGTYTTSGANNNFSAAFLIGGNQSWLFRNANDKIYSHFFYGLVRRAAVYNYTLSSLQAYEWALGRTPPNPELLLVADPRYFNDVDGDGKIEWIDLSGSGNHARLYGYNGYQGFTYSLASFNVKVGTYTVEKTLYSAVCNAQLCSFAVQGVPPSAMAIVVDAANRTYVGYGGISLPYNPWARDVLVWFANRTSLPYLFAGSENAAAKFIVFLIALAVFWGMSTVGQWEAGLLAMSVVLLLSQLWTGFDVYSSIVSTAAFIAAFSLIIKKVREA